MKKILITGGMGFIGKRLVRKLLSRTDKQLVVVDNLSSCQIEKDLVRNKQIEFIEGDFGAWEAPAGDEYCQIYHLAAPVGPVRVLEYAGQIAGLIVNHVYKAAEMAMKMEARLLIPSTSEVYGQNAAGPQDEMSDKIVPGKITVRLEYGVAKMLSEILLKNLSTVKPLKYNFVRPFNIVGPQQNAGSGFVVPRFVKMALAGEPITVYGDGKMVRTFTHVDDFTDAIIGIMESDISGEIFNVGNPGNTATILELAQKVKNLSQSSSKISFVDPKKLFGDSFEEAWDKIPDIKKISKAIGWEPKWTLDDIIRQSIEFEKDTLIKSSYSTQEFHDLKSKI